MFWIIRNTDIEKCMVSLFIMTDMKNVAKTSRINHAITWCYQSQWSYDQPFLSPISFGTFFRILVKTHYSTYTQPNIRYIMSSFVIVPNEVFPFFRNSFLGRNTAYLTSLKNRKISVLEVNFSSLLLAKDSPRRDPQHPLTFKDLLRTGGPFWVASPLLFSLGIC